MVWDHARELEFNPKNNREPFEENRYLTILNIEHYYSDNNVKNQFKGVGELKARKQVRIIGLFRRKGTVAWIKIMTVSRREENKCEAYLEVINEGNWSWLDERVWVKGKTKSRMIPK